jgi:hypothetical protein
MNELECIFASYDGFVPNVTLLELVFIRGMIQLIEFNGTSANLI